MPAATHWIPGNYPPARRSEHADLYNSTLHGGVIIPDPYNYLEDNASTETVEFRTEQSVYAQAYFDSNPDYDRLLAAFNTSNDYQKFYPPQLRDDGRFYWFYNSGLDAQTALWRSKDCTLPNLEDSSDSGGELFFDPNVLAESASLATYGFSRCGKYFAYAISLSGSEDLSIFVRDVNCPLTSDTDPENDSGRFPEEVKFVKFSAISWSPDSKGYFYQRYPEPPASSDEGGTETDTHAMLCYHRLGTDQEKDVLVFKDDENPERMFHMEVSEDNKHLLLYILRDSSRENLLWQTEFDPDDIGLDMKWNKVMEEWGAEYDLVTARGSVLYLRTNHFAPQYKVITVDVSNNNAVNELIPESDAYLSMALCVNKDYFALIYKRNVKDEIYIYDIFGKQVKRLAEDFIGSASLTAREKQNFFIVSLSGFTSPGMLARYDFDKPEGEQWEIFRTTKLTGLNTEDFESTQVWYNSKDGTRIPMFIVRHKSTQLDGTAAAIQYGYGGFSISIDPFFSSTILTFLQKYGVILAVPSIRGGGEFGEKWHLEATREKKGNSFDDFIAATEYLVNNKYAAPGKVILNGGSNGGLLVTACVNQAPEGTFGCVIAEVGVYDLLKFNKFTIGKAWMSDYGNPDNADDFDFIYPISPLHNVPLVKDLPPTLLLTAPHDDRVVPMHSYKYVAELQYRHADNPHPILLRVDKQVGHSAGKSTQQKLCEHAEKWGFAVQSLGLEWKDDPPQTKHRTIDDP